MRLLLDTHAFIWWIEDNPKLGVSAAEKISSAENEVLFSAVSSWEIAIKHSQGKLELDKDPQFLVPEQISKNGFVPLPINVSHTLKVGTLEGHHRDPFDRLLIAQSIVERAPIVSDDPMLARYGVNTIW